jgi:ferritin-like metal-binding protein YciE/uncharacterized protein YdaT
MRWRLTEIPESIQDLQQEVRNRALNIAEQLVSQGQDRAKALREAIGRAQSMGKAQDAMDNVPPEREFHVLPSDGQWVLRNEADAKTEYNFESKKQAVEEGVERVEKIKGNLYVHDAQGRFEEIHSYASPEKVGKATEGVTVRLESLEDLYVEQLQDLYSGEEQLIVALERLQNKATNSELKKAFASHLEETREQKQMLEQVFGRLGQQSGKETCEAMAGIIYESEEIIQACADPNTCDAGLIASAQRAEHYEIAGYGSAHAYAEQLGFKEDAKVLETILKQEKSADRKLNKIAEEVINPKAANKK